MNQENTIISFNFGEKYRLIKDEWFKRTTNKCSSHSNIKIITLDDINIQNFKLNNEYAWWDIARLIHIDQDIIIEKDIKPLIDLPYDIIISKEIGNEKAFPAECSKILGLGVCSGFYILKPSSFKFMSNILNNMKNKKYGSYSDQVNLMNYIVNNKYELSQEDIILDEKNYTNKIIKIDDIKICVLDFNIITRDPIINDGQFGNHINIDNVGGVNTFLRYFNEDIEKLPLTCRCGKTHLGDNNVCNHLEIRKNKLRQKLLNLNK